jgi:hypothetical protein
MLTLSVSLVRRYPLYAFDAPNLFYVGVLA